MDIVGVKLRNGSSRKFTVFVKDLETNKELGIIRWDSDLRMYNFEPYSDIEISEEMYKRIHRLKKELNLT